VPDAPLFPLSTRTAFTKIASSPSNCII
jgi:hypothetical protein